jgi:release factor glutamine methyltransferase
LVRNNEPRLALDGGDDGLDSIKSICKLAPMLLAPGGWLLLEHHHDQSEAVLKLLRHAGLELVDAKSDLEGTLRFAVARAGGGD